MYWKKLNRASKYAEFYADFKSVEKLQKAPQKVCLKSDIKKKKIELFPFYYCLSTFLGPYHLLVNLFAAFSTDLNSADNFACLCTAIIKIKLTLCHVTFTALSNLAFFL
jgi:hypothetical protein